MAGMYPDKKILYANDEWVIAEGVKDFLEREIGCQVSIALDPKAAIDELKREKYDVLITDMRFGPTKELRYAGQEIIKEARKIGGDKIFIIVNTGVTGEEVVVPAWIRELEPEQKKAELTKLYARYLEPRTHPTANAVLKCEVEQSEETLDLLRAFFDGKLQKRNDIKRE